mmetsp:Transcript_11840/g.24650  ORF Transcript_11840/g.24650 Transcript_11840/m.24650 type:complete len:81 (+) Transcript_11840:322-564(+)
MTTKWYKESWKDLPADKMDAAKVLGYDEKLWDGNKETAITEDCDWDELEAPQQAAAAALGYTKETYDRDEDSSSSSSDEE